MLPDSYKFALQALKDQASAASQMLDSKINKTGGKRSPALTDAQQQMSKYKAECSAIVRALLKAKDRNYTIPTMTEDDLSALLGFN